MTDTTSAGKQKIAVIGGGMSSMTAIFEITSLPGWQDKYDITVYQMGWRIGGKGACGRNLEKGMRIEEHGIHYWFGFYENAFSTMRKCYEELNRPKGAPLATFDEAFECEDYMTMCQNINNTWLKFRMYFANPFAKGQPGDDDNVPEFTPKAVYKALFYSLRLNYKEISKKHKLKRKHDITISHALEGHGLPHELAHILKEIEAFALSGLYSIVDLILYFLFEAVELLFRLGIWLLPPIVKKLLHYLWDEVADLVQSDPDVLQLWQCFDFTIAVMIGMIEDKVIESSEVGGGWTQVFNFSKINEWDYIDWLAHHGADPKYTLCGPLVRSMYDGPFAFVKGNINEPNMEAGTILPLFLKLTHMFRGHVIYKMMSGMGDTIFAPIYLVLKRRGVKFEFFQKAHRVRLSPDRKSISSVSMERQFDILPGKSYEPLMVVKDLDCWPSTPLLDNVVPEQAAKYTQMIKDGINADLESYWTAWQGTDYELKHGVDYDILVLGVGLGAAKHICTELVNTNEKWRLFVEKVSSVATQGFQAWMNVDYSTLGQTEDNLFLSTYVEPLDTYADMTHLLDREDWPVENGPKLIAYWCGVLEDAPYIPPPSDHNFPATQRERVKKYVRDTHLPKYMPMIWPECIDQNGEFKWEYMYDPTDAQGHDRINYQYFRANVDPTERYSLALRGTSKYRLRTNETGVDNFLITGAHIQNGLNAGFVEGAVMSGILTARAITGHIFPIKGGIEIPPPIKDAAMDNIGYPKYIDFKGNIAQTIPAIQKHCLMYSFIFRGDTDKIQATLDERLNFMDNRPDKRYMVASSLVLVVFSYSPAGFSTTGPDSQKGYTAETTVTFFVMAAECKLSENNDWVGEKLQMFIPLIVVDNPFSFVAGREIFGFPKTVGFFNVPSDRSYANYFGVSTLGYRQFSPTTQSEVHQWISIINRDGTPPEGRPIQVITNKAEALALIQKKKAELDQDFTKGLDWYLDLIELLWHHEVPVVFLKQMRDATDSSLACYQAIVEATIPVEGFEGLGILGSDYQIEIHHLASFPIEEILGIQSGDKALFAYWVEVDMGVNSGKEVWKG